MCGSKPKIPKPVAIQEVQQPALADIKRRRGNTSTANGTLLTGPSGIAAGAMSTGAPTLLGS